MCIRQSAARARERDGRDDEHAGQACAGAVRRAARLAARRRG